MKVLCLTTRGLDKPSTHYRFVQFVDFFRDAGVQIEFITRDALDTTQLAALPNYDLLLNQRCLLSLRRARAVIRSARRSLLDFDDAIYTRSGRSRSWITSLRVHARLRFLLRCSHLTTVANEHLAAYARRHAKQVEIVPMALDAKVWHPIEKTGGTRPVRIGWSGSPVNLGQIERLGTVLAPLFIRRHQLQLAILCGRRPTLPFEFDYQPFQPGTEPDFVRSLDIGLLPLVQDEFTRGKSPIKALQYMSCGVPVVGNVFGGAAEMLDETNSVTVAALADWPAALTALAHNVERRRQFGIAGLTRFRDRHELRVVGGRWLALFRREKI